MERNIFMLALEALEGFIPYLPLKDEAQCNRYDLATTAIKAALAQPAQEPVATIAVREHTPVGKVAYVLEVNLPVGIHKLYTPAQRPWVGLTEDQIKVIEEIALTKQWAIRMAIAQLKECNI